MNRADAVEQLKDVYRILSADMAEAKGIALATPTQFAHRSMVRTYFSLVEGLSFQLRQVTLATLGDEEGRLSIGEIALLREQRYKLNAKGEPEANENFQRFLPNLLFTIHCYLKNHGASFQPDTSHHGWQSMKYTVGLRNRITHPKSVSDLTLTNEDLRHVVEASAWWNRTLFAMFDACQEADAEWTARLDATRNAG